jgi:antitoxin component of MazEF toxin-antitoxin module
MSRYEVRKVFRQSGKSVAVVIPLEFAERLGLVNGSYVRITEKEGRLIIEKLEEAVQA